MLFNSKIFVVFALVVLGLYYSLSDRKKLWLLFAASYVFYGYWNFKLCGLIFASTVVDFLCGQRIHASDDPRQRRRWLMGSLAFNLGALGFFKYYDFFVYEFALGAQLLGFDVPADSLMLNLVLPVGISFYTFQTMSYTIDIYRRQFVPEESFLRFAIYVAFFPQLIAGPVERAQHLLPQFSRPFRLSLDMVRAGVFLILLGYIKKVVIADRIAAYIEPYYNNPVDDGVASFLCTLLFNTQVYADFSSYSDIAIGLGLLLGYNIRANFDLPFVTRSMAARYRRWHISMGHWFRDYIFIPLGGSRGSFARTQLNIMIVMFLSGLWHGASNNFVLWGLLNGLVLVIHRFLKRPLGSLRTLSSRNPVTERSYFYACAWFTYCLLASINIFFRSPDWETSKQFVRAIFLSGWAQYADFFAQPTLTDELWNGVYFTLVIFAVHEAERYLRVKDRILGNHQLWAVTCLAAFWAIVTFGINGPQFIYFQF